MIKWYLKVRKWFIPSAFEDQGQDLPLCVSPRRFALRVLGATKTVVNQEMLSLHNVPHHLQHNLYSKLQFASWCGAFFKKLNFNSWNQELLLVTVVLAFWVWSDFAQALNKCTQKACHTRDTTKDTCGLFPGTLVVVDPSLSWQELLLLPEQNFHHKKNLASTRDAQQLRVDAWRNSRFAFFEVFEPSLCC